MVGGLEYKKTGDLEQICAFARDRCKNGIVHNLLLAYEFPFELIRSEFVGLHEADAQDWLNEKPIASLPFSHGQYFLGERGIQHVTTELRGKSASRRALLSLISMQHIIDSGDDPIPSFLIAQFGRVDDTLYVTAYYRALEVGRFLPINITELCLLTGKVSAAISRPKSIRLLIVAFHAHLTPDFHCLRRAELDVVAPSEIGFAVAKLEVGTILRWLEGKRHFESEILITNLKQLFIAVKKADKAYPALFQSELEKALKTLTVLKETRSTSSDESSLNRVREEFLGHIDKAMQELGSMPHGV